MLDRTETFRCIECGLPQSSPLFHFHGTEPGLAYWSDRGVLCSPQCSLAHQRMRAAEGTLQHLPAPVPRRR